MSPKNFSLRFAGKSISSSKIPYSFLRDILNNFEQLAQESMKISEDKKQFVEFNLEIEDGSLVLNPSPLDNDDYGFQAISNASGILSRLADMDSDDDFLNNSIIKKRIHNFLKIASSNASELQFTVDGVQNEVIPITDDLIASYNTEEEASAFEEHILFFPQIDTKSKSVGFLPPTQTKKIKAKFKDPYIPILKPLVHEWVYVKLDKPLGMSKRKSILLHNVKGIPKLAQELSSDNFQVAYEGLLEKNNSFSTYELGWDGASAKPFSQGTVQTAQNFLKRVLLMMEVLGLPELFPDIVPGVDDKIQFEWSYQENYLEIEFDIFYFDILINVGGGDREYRLDKYEETFEFILEFLRKVKNE